jgi:hypothetical protein
MREKYIVYNIFVNYLICEQLATIPVVPIICSWVAASNHFAIYKLEKRTDILKGVDPFPML